MAEGFAENINANRKDIEAVHKCVLNALEIPQPTFEKDERGHLMPQYSQATCVELMDYINATTHTSDYFDNVYFDYWESNGVPALGSKWVRAKLVWALASVAAGDQVLANRSGMIRGCLANEVRTLSLLYDTPDYRKAMATHIGILADLGLVTATRDPYEIREKPNGETYAAFRYALATERPRKYPKKPAKQPKEVRHRVFGFKPNLT